MGKKSESRKRTLRKINIKKQGPNVILEYVGESFLHRPEMIRILSGTLVYVGIRKVQAPGTYRPSLKSRDRMKAGPTLPPTGLFLVKVFYPKVFPPVKKHRPKARGAGMMNRAEFFILRLGVPWGLFWLSGVFSSEGATWRDHCVRTPSTWIRSLVILCSGFAVALRAFACISVRTTQLEWLRIR